MSRVRDQRRRTLLVQHHRENPPHYAGMEPGGKCDQCGRRLAKGYAEMWEDVTLCKRGTGCRK